MVTGKDSMEISKFDIQAMLCKVHRTLNDFLGLNFFNILILDLY